MNLDIIKNPFVIAIIFAVITYLYLWWEEKKKVENNPNYTQNISMVTPIIGAVIGFALGYIIFGFGHTEVAVYDPKLIGQQIMQQGGVNPNAQIIQLPIQQPQIPVQNITNPVHTLGSESFHVLAKNRIKLPNSDVFIDIAR